MRLLLFFLIGFFFLGNAQKMNTKDWIEDLNYIETELPKRHINLYKSISEQDYKAKINMLKEQISELESETIIWELTKLLSAIQDNHTLLQFSINKQFPVGFEWLSDGYYITAISRDNENFMAAKLLAINGIPVTELENKITTVLYVHNAASKKLLVANVLKNVSLLQYLGIVSKNTAQLKVLTLNNEQKTLAITFNPEHRRGGQMAFAMPNKIPLFKQNSRSWFWSTSIDNSTLYIKYNVSNSREALVANNTLKNASPGQIERIPSFIEFTNVIINELNSKPYTKLIFDIRGNTGGHPEQGTSLLNAIKNTQFFKENGKVATLVDAKIFSSAIKNIIDSKMLLNAIVIGQETSGSPNHFGNIEVMQLPNSKLKLQYSTHYFKFGQENDKTIKPDIAVPVTIQDFITGEDPVLQQALSM